MTGRSKKSEPRGGRVPAEARPAAAPSPPSEEPEQLALFAERPDQRRKEWRQ